MTNPFGYELRASDVGRLEVFSPVHIRELITAYGLVTFKGFNASQSQYEQFTDAVAPCDPINVVKVPAGGIDLGYHSEESHTPYRPDVLWILCVHPGDDGGTATIVGDGVQIFAEMSDEWRRFCREHRLRYGRLWAAEAWRRELGAEGRAELEATLEAIEGVSFEFLDDGALLVSYETPFVVRTQLGEESFANSAPHAPTYPHWYGVTLEDGSPVPEGLVSHVNEVAARHEARVHWDAGDFVAIDNIRTMHRRPPYNGSGRILARRHCESFYGGAKPDASTRAGAFVKGLLTLELGDDPVYKPIRTGPLSADRAGATLRDPVTQRS